MSRKNSRLLISILAGLFFFAGTASFAQNLADIQAAIKAKGQKWIAQETSISVLPDDEKKVRLGLIKPRATGKEQVVSVQEPMTGLPATVDWVQYVSDVRDQKSCGSCWAFATTAALEAHILIQNGMPFAPDDNRAEQIVLSCSGGGSCSGGYISTASSYIQSTGLPPESYFQYTATNNSCGNAQSGWQDNVRKIGAWSYVNTTPANLTAIKNALVTYGPLVTTMDVYYDFYLYGGGVYEYSTGNYQGGHAILIVGYTDDSSRADGGYFKVKNSWGAGWGSGGYFLIGYSQLNSVVGFGEWTIAYSTPALPSPPVGPGGLGATPVSSSQINLSWTDGSTNEDGFKIERCSGTGCGNFVQIATVGANVTSYGNTGLTASTAYSYRVRAYNAGGDSAYSITASATTQAPPQPPAGPGNLTASAISTAQVNLNWGDNSNNEDGFKIERCSGDGCSSFAQIATVGANIKTYSNSGLTAGTAYSYRVRAYNAGGDSAYSNSSSATTQSCSYSLSPASASFSSNGGTATVIITAGAGCGWTAKSSSSWINVTPQTAKGQGNGSFTYRVGQNKSSDRTGTVMAGGQNHAVTQTKK